jgi:predicted N-acetyltransferase YhbS
MMAVRVRPIAPADARAARALVESESADTPYVAQSRWALESALAGRAADARALVAVDEARDEVVGLVAYGPVGGAEGTARVLGFAVTAASRLRGVGTTLCEAMAAELGGAGVRLLVAEVPDDPVTAPE